MSVLNDKQKQLFEVIAKIRSGECDMEPKEVLNLMREAFSIENIDNASEAIREIVEGMTGDGMGVIALSSEQLDALRNAGEGFEQLGERLTELLSENSISMHVNVLRDLKDPRYAPINLYSRMEASMQPQLTRTMQSFAEKGGAAIDSLEELQNFMIATGNINFHLQRMQSALDDPRAEKLTPAQRKSMRKRLSLLMAAQTLGMNNLFDIAQTGNSRLNWLGFDDDELQDTALQILAQTCDQISAQSPLDRDMIVTMFKHAVADAPLSPLPPEDVFVDDFDCPVFTKIGLGSVVAKLKTIGVNSIKQYLEETDGLADCKEKCGLSDEESDLLASMMSRLSAHSIEASDAVNQIRFNAENRQVYASAATIPVDHEFVRRAIGERAVALLKKNYPDVVQFRDVMLHPVKDYPHMFEGSNPDKVGRLLRFLQTGSCDCKACVGERNSLLKDRPDLEDVYLRHIEDFATPDRKQKIESAITDIIQTMINSK